MYDEPFEGFGPLLKMARDRANEDQRKFKNDDVIDFTRTKMLKELRQETGQGGIVPVPLRPLTKAEIGQRLNKPKLIAGPGWMGESDGKE